MLTVYSEIGFHAIGSISQRNWSEKEADRLRGTATESKRMLFETFDRDVDLGLLILK